MKKIIILLFLLSFTSSCTKDKNPISNNDDIFITKFSMEGMRNEHLPDFDFVRKQARWREGREFVLKNENTDNIIYIRVGIHPSKIKAQEIVEEYMKWTAAVFREDSMKVLGIGDRCWWTSSFDKPSNYIFIRNNFFISVMSSPMHYYQDILKLTKLIDNNIINNTDYVEIGNSILLPEIHSITALKTELQEGENTKVTIHASDPYNESLEYVVVGLTHVEIDPENVFTLTATRSHVPSPFFGPHSYNFIAVNESNVVSEVVEFEIKIIQ